VAQHPAVQAEVVTVGASPSDSIPWVNSVFEQPWWLDAVAPGRWDSVVVRHGEEVVARMPYTWRRQFGMTMLVQPPYTQTLGPWLAPSAGRYSRRLDREKQLLGDLIAGLPPFGHFHMACSPALTNWLPFHWAGFQASVRYTYRLEDLTDLDRIRSDFHEHVRRAIRKAEQGVTVDHDYPIDDLLRLDARTYARQGMRSPASTALVRRLEAACAARGARRILAAVDAQGRTHAALLVVWDERTMYALINARDPEYQAFGSNTLLYWEAIRLASQVARVFDFEGSMLEPIEHFVRGFGGRQTPYFAITKSGRRARAMLAARSSARDLGRLIRSRDRR
jgi:Acetyltransferase (GNAT) domain